MGEILGYARVSTGDQDVAGQTMRLTEAGAIKVFTDVRSDRTMEGSVANCQLWRVMLLARGLARAHAASSRSPTSWTASVSADGPRPKARSTRRASPRMSRVRLKIAA